MSDDQNRSGVFSALAAIAPEADLTTLSPTVDMREALDLDSMDVLRFAAALHDRFGIDVPEADYGAIITIDGCLRYLREHAPP